MVRKHKEIYKCDNGNIYMWDEFKNDAMYYLGRYCTNFKKNGGNFINAKNIEIKQVEKEWLLYCINIDKFIEFEKFLSLYKTIYELW